LVEEVKGKGQVVERFSPGYEEYIKEIGWV
jgi:hypothetical protein